MSFDNPQDSKRFRDPLIHGAAPKADAVRDLSMKSATVEIYDLLRSNPLADFVALFRNPKKFFRSFSLVRKPNAWMWMKLVLGLFVIQAMVQLASSGTLAHQQAESLEALRTLRDQSGWLNKSQFAWIEHNLLHTYPVVMQFSSFVVPLTVLLGAFFQACSAFICLPFLGVNKDQFSLAQLTLVMGMAKWFQIFEIVPFLGSFVAWLAVALLSIYNLKWLFQLSFGRALVASHMLSWLIVFACFAAVVAFSLGLVMA